MRILLIDTENVGHRWIKSCKVDKNDKVILFHSENSGNITKGALDDLALKLKGEVISQNKCKFEELPYVLVNNKVDFELVSCEVGHNAMDFQLVSYLGMLVVEYSEADFAIISDDHGYDPVVSMWNKKGIHVRRTCVSEQGEVSKKKKNKKQAPVEIVSTLKKKKPEVKSIVADILINEEDEIVEQTTNLFIKHYISNRNNFCHVLKSTYGKKKGENLNKCIQKNANKILAVAS